MVCFLSPANCYENCVSTVNFTISGCISYCNCSHIEVSVDCNGLLYLAIQSVLTTVIYCNFSCISQHLEEPFESSVVQWHQYAHSVYLLPISE